MVTSYYIMKMNKKTISMEEYYSDLHNTPAVFSKSEHKTKCRVCLQEGDVCVTTDVNYSEFKQALNIFGNININDEKENLTYLCNICYKFLKSAMLFRKVAILTNEKLQQSSEHLDDHLATFGDSKSNFVDSNKDLICQRDTDVDCTQIQCPLCSNLLDKSSCWIHLKKHNMVPVDEISLDEILEEEHIRSPVSKEADESSHNGQLDKYNGENYEKQCMDQQRVVEDDSTRVQCPVCEEFISRLLYKVHILKEHNISRKSENLKDARIQCTKPKYVKCIVCKKVISKSFYKRHLNKHNIHIERFQKESKHENGVDCDDGIKIVCPICGKFFSKSSHWQHVKEHYSKRHTEKSFKLELEKKSIEKNCDKPNHMFSLRLEDQNPQALKVIEDIKEINLLEHLQDHQSIVIFHEDISEENMIEVHTDNIEEEINTLNEETSNEVLVDEVLCHICQEILKKSYFIAHLMEEHNIMPIDDKSLEQELKDEKKVQLQCLICSKHLSLLSYADHMQRHEVQRPVCPICKKIFKTVPIFKQHLEFHNPNDKCICEICGKSCKTKMHYSSHIVTHETQYIYKCKLCPFAARYKNNLRVHMKMHSGELKYLCTHCPARYVYLSSLKLHILRRHMERQYKCDSCDKAYISKLELQRHIDSAHLGIRNHECNICGIAFGSRTYLLKHQRRVHKKANNNPFLNRAISLALSKKLMQQ